MRNVGKHDYLPITLSLYQVYVDDVLERYPDLRQEMSSKANQLSNNNN